jgi:pimeloyl-ACP methyl ester carboxylesterase
MRISEIGSYRAGGRTVRIDGAALREIMVTRNASIVYDPNGIYPVEHAWAEYYVPERRREGPPVVLVHGGGLHGGMWSTTPDGRPGWLQCLLDLDYEVHVVDNVERGRAGWMPGLFEGEPVLRNLEEAWRLFRLGRPEDFAGRRAFAGCRFPVDSLETFGRFACPRWTSSRAAQTDAFEAVLDRLGNSIVICHSQGAEIAFEAASRSPERVSRIIAVEPSGYADDMTRLRTVPITLVLGDFLDCSPSWQAIRERWRAVAGTILAAGGTIELFDCARRWPGTTHMLMMDHGNEEILAELMRAVASAV